MLIVLDIVAVCLLTFLLRRWYVTKKLDKKSKRLPPGPPKFPILGHLPLLGFKPHVTLTKWKETYGPIISIQFGSMQTVVLNDAKLIREAFGQQIFSGRPYISIYDKALGGKKGLSMNDGQDGWDQRKVVAKGFQRLRSTIESKIQQEVDQLLIVDLGSKTGQKVAMRHRFSGHVLNGLWAILMGQRFESEDQQLIEMVKNIELGTTDFSMLTSLAIAIPWLGNWFPNFCGITQVIESIQMVIETIGRHIDHHEENRIFGQPRDFTDFYLDKVAATEDPMSSLHVDAKNQPLTTAEIIAAATETTCVTLEWLIVYMVHHPQIQVKMQQEIDQVIGHSRRPALTDRFQMTYTEAVLNETMRFASSGPFGMFHSTMDNVDSLGGYEIPKDTVIMPNFYCVNHDPQVWGDPDQFRPERFLDAHGQLVRFDHFLPFSVGRRRCLGEEIARSTLFLYCAGLFQKFDISMTDKAPSLDSNKMGFVLAPQPFEVVLNERRI